MAPKLIPLYIHNYDQFQLWEISSVLSSLDGEDAIAVAMDTVWLMTTKLESGFEQAKVRQLDPVENLEGFS